MKVGGIFLLSFQFSRWLRLRIRIHREKPQVKSARKHQLTCRVKLSNMLLAAQSPYPWFLVFITDDTGHRSTRIYVVHIWDQLIEKLLSAFRAENEGIALNKRELTIRFDASDNHGDSLVAWMYDAIKAVEPDYEQQKRIIFQTIGYEERGARAWPCRPPRTRCSRSCCATS